MPGLLMEQQPSGIATATLKDEIANSSSVPVPALQVTGTNGVNGVDPVKKEDISEQKDDGLPPLDGSWRESAANVHFGKLLDRMAEGCMADFHDLITKFNNESSTPTQTNGMHLPGAEDQDPASLELKRQFMKFAVEWRERFIKARIISDWARNSGEEVGKLIDIRNTIQKRGEDVKACLSAVMGIKVDTVNVRMPEYNLRGAMQYLSTGKSSYPDLGYIQPPPLTAKEILDMMHEMEIASHIRVYMHEPVLPYWMANYKVANGRVTFSTKGEFEIDLAITDEDPKVSPWYFVDFRFSFSPAPTISDIDRPLLEAQVNAAAVTNSLPAIYDFCHTFTLEFKLSEFEAQAYALLKGRWFDTIRIERVRRVIIIQYWAGRGGKKSWIELNVHSGKGLVAKHLPSTPTLIALWHKDGQVVPGYLEVDWVKIDTEKLLTDVIKRHAEVIMDNLQAALAAKQTNPGVFMHNLEEDETNPSVKRLVIKLLVANSADTKLIVFQIQRYTGAWKIVAPTMKVEALRPAVAGNPEIMTADVAIKLACDVMQQDIEVAVQGRGWKQVYMLQPEHQRDFGKLFEHQQHVSVWKCADPYKAWPKDWHIGYSTSVETTPRWWVVRHRKDGYSYIATAAQQLEVTTFEWKEALDQVERLALKQVQALENKTQTSISYHTERYVPRGQLTPTGTEVIFIDPSELVGKKSTPFWAEGLARISDGRLFRPDQQFMRLTVRPGQLAYLQQHLPVKDIKYNETNGLAIKYSQPGSRSIWISARIALEHVSKLDQMLKTTSRLSCKPKTISMDEFAFTYGQQDFSALLVFKYSNDNNNKHHTELKLYPTKTNPHQRIHRHLQHLLNQEQINTFGNFAYTLLLTLPLLTSFDKLDPAIWTIHMRQATWYALQYAGTSKLSFTIRAQKSSTRVRWLMSQDKRPSVSQPTSTTTVAAAAAPPSEDSEKSLPADLANDLQNLWTSPGNGCEAIKDGVIADANGIARVTDKLASICAGR